MRSITKCGRLPYETFWQAVWELCDGHWSLGDGTINRGRFLFGPT